MYYLNLMNTPHLWSEKKAKHTAAISRHLKNKRFTLKDITGSRTISHHSMSTTIALYNDIDIDLEPPPVVDPIIFEPITADFPSDLFTPNPLTVPPSPPHPPPLSSSLSFVHQVGVINSSSVATSAPAPPRLDIPPLRRCKCGQYQFNQSCTSKLCQKCCGKLMDHCSVTSHVKHKPLGYQAAKYKSSAIAATAIITPPPDVRPGVIDHLTKAMKQGKEVYIAYANRDPNEKQARKVKPLEWIRYGEAIKALCFIDNMEKTFNTHKILRIEDQSWVAWKGM
jgi:hypothetical protein